MEKVKLETSSGNSVEEYDSGVVHPIASGELDRLIGKLLTHIDASIADKEQRVALKTLIKQMVWRWFEAAKPYSDYRITYLREDGDSNEEGGSLFAGKRTMERGNAPLTSYRPESSLD